jgi:membrane protein implicated in regulation of membrane protease activity
MEAWVVWLIIAGVLAVVELFTLTFDLALLAAAALVAAGAGALGLGAGFQFLAFALAAAGALGFVRPMLARHVRRPPALRSGTSALVGREARAVTEVTRDSGLVRIGGEEWTARPYDSELVIPEGAMVDVLAIEGATALVHPREELL